MSDPDPATTAPAAGSGDAAIPAQVLADQHELVWALARYHLDLLTEVDLHWTPAPLHWTLRQDTAGGWVSDWSDAEPDPIPVPTIAWITWHLGWWWSTALAHLEGQDPPAREDVAWPGDRDGVCAWLEDLHRRWIAAVTACSSADLAAEAPFPWPPGSGRTVADLLAWANAELMKNVAELGQVRLLRHAHPAG